MYYSDDLIEEIRIQNEIVDVISSYVKLQKKGNNYLGICPFHNEKTPSFSVSSQKQMYHCFGCGVGGSVITFVMEYENFTFAEALRLLGQRVGISLPEEEYSEEAKKQISMKHRLLEINKQAAKYFYYQLKSERGIKAYEYLRKRELKEETIKRFGLGYSNKYSNDLYIYLKNIGYEDEILKQSGLITMQEAKGAYDKFWNRIIFPIMDVNNRVIGFGGRVMGDGMPKYLNSPETKLFDKSRNLYGLNFARISKKKGILICEGYMDVIALYQAGFHNTVASLGTAFTGLQANLLKRYTDEVYLTYDSDSAGIKAALRAIPILKEVGLSVKVINMTPYKDPDEFIKTLGVEEFKKRMKEANNSFFFEIEQLEQQYELSDPEQKTRFYNQVAKKLVVFTEEIERNNYIEAVAKKYQVTFDNLRKLVNRYGAQMLIVGDEIYYKKEEVSSKKKKTIEDGVKQSQKMLLTWLIEDTRIFQAIKGIIEPKDFLDPFYYQVATLVFEQYKVEQQVIPAKIINQFETKEEQNEVADLFHTSIPKTLNKMGREKAFNEIIKKIKQFSLDYESKHATDLKTLQKIVKEQSNLQKLHISLMDG